VLEALARGVPVVSTRVGDAPRYYRLPALAGCCVAPDDPEALGLALAMVAESYEPMRRAFAENGEQLRAIHRDAPRTLLKLMADAGGGRPAR
jgi:glycosyltransferase involved in cell wall biosynthesis